MHFRHFIPTESHLAQRLPGHPVVLTRASLQRNDREGKMQEISRVQTELK